MMSNQLFITVKYGGKSL